MIDLEKHITEMRALANQLVKFSSSAKIEDSISVLKTREVAVDGYEIVLYYGKTERRDGTFLESFQCLGQSSPFLPFSLVVKLARRFLGDKNIGFVDIYSEDKKIYCWVIVTNKEGDSLHFDEKIRDMDYDGLKFSYLDHESINFF